MKISIINGTNLNLIGIREPDVYGDESMVQLLKRLKSSYADHEIAYFQSNEEGILIERVQKDGMQGDVIILNPGAYTHSSIGLMDAVKAVSCPVIEVHISNIHGRESYREKSWISAVCKGQINGFGMDVYELAVLYATKFI